MTNAEKWDSIIKLLSSKTEKGTLVWTLNKDGMKKRFVVQIQLPHSISIAEYDRH